MSRVWGVASALAMIGCGRIAFDDQALRDAGGDALPDGDGANAISLVQVQAPGYVGANSITVPFDVTAGHFLLAVLYWDQSPDPIMLTDTLGLTWTALPEIEVVAFCGGGTGNATAAQLMYSRIGVTGSDTITLTQTAPSSPLGMFLVEYDGVDLVNPIGNRTMQVAPSASNAMFMPDLTVDAPGVIVAFFGDSKMMGDCTPGAGYTAQALDPGFPNMFEDRHVTAGTYTVDGLLPVGHNDDCWIGSAFLLHSR